MHMFFCHFHLTTTFETLAGAEEGVIVIDCTDQNISMMCIERVLYFLLAHLVDEVYTILSLC